jgi:hypothetical protein
MTPDALRWPVVFTGNTAVYFAPTDEFGSAYLGGPLEQEFDGIEFGTEPLHRVFTFSPAGMTQPGSNNLQARMSLYFGLRYPACQLSYDVKVTDGVNAQYINDWETKTQITAMTPVTSEPNWPYRNYPALLPYVRMKEIERVPMTPEQFAEQHIQQGLPELTAAEICVVVPAISVFGVSMWGPAGDDAGTQIVFLYGYKTHEVRAYTSAA